MDRRKLPFTIITIVVLVLLGITVQNVMNSWSLERELMGPNIEAAPDAVTPETPHTTEYRTFPKIGSRVAIWIVAQLHLMFAAFVLAVPMFALIIEYIGYRNGDKKYDKLAYEFTKLLSVSFSFTATLGAMPDIHADDTLSKANELHDRYIQLDLLSLCAPVLRRSRIPLQLLLWVGQVLAKGSPRPGIGAKHCWYPPSCLSPMPG